MVPRAVQDAGYTAVGLGVLALQQVQIRRRAVVSGVRAIAAPVTDRLSGLTSVPRAVGQLIESGSTRLCTFRR